MKCEGSVVLLETRKHTKSLGLSLNCLEREKVVSLVYEF